MAVALMLSFDRAPLMACETVASPGFSTTLIANNELTRRIKTLQVQVEVGAVAVVVDSETSLSGYSI